MRLISRTSPIIAAALLFGACSGQSAMDDAMQADLAAAATSTLELAPRAGATPVVSAIESKNPAHPRVAAARRASAPVRAPQPETRQVTQASAPEPAATRPAPAPAVNPPPPGGYKTVGEVIRNAPFPIKP